MMKCPISPTSDWGMDWVTFCRHPTKNMTSSFSVATTLGLHWPRCGMTISASTGASETRILKFWTVARASSLMGKMLM